MGSARADTPPRSNQYPIPDRMQAWVLGGPEELSLVDKPVPQPGPAEVLVRVDAIAVCATDIEIIRHGVPAMIDGGLPFNRGFTPGHEYMGTVVKLGPTVDEFQIGDRVTVEVHAGCGRCQRCREGMYTSCLNYGYRAKGHRANGFSTDGGFAEYAVNSINTLAHIPAEPVPVDLAYLVRNNIYVFGIRGEGKSATHRAAALMAQKRFDAKLIHTHTFPLAEVPTAIRYARERIEDAIKVVVQIREN